MRRYPCFTLFPSDDNFSAEDKPPYALTESTSATELLDKKGNLSFSVMFIASTEMFQVTV
jgi:hypothetical protein